MFSLTLQLYVVLVTQVNFFVDFSIPGLDMSSKDQVNNCCHFGKKKTVHCNIIIKLYLHKIGQYH